MVKSNIETFVSYLRRKTNLCKIVTNKYSLCITILQSYKDISKSSCNVHHFVQFSSMMTMHKNGISRRNSNLEDIKVSKLKETVGILPLFIEQNK